ncbi:MAG: hypothetical protein QM754_00050 [Tepidisphaeraceae bacterium]
MTRRWTSQHHAPNPNRRSAKAREPAVSANHATGNPTGSGPGCTNGDSANSEFDIDANPEKTEAVNTEGKAKILNVNKNIKNPDKIQNKTKRIPTRQK